MPYIKIPTQHKHTFTPAAASAIGGSWRSVAGQVRSLAGELRTHGSALSSTWEGNSAQQFMGEFSRMPGETDSSADLLDGLASQVESITVTEWVTKWESVWSTEY